MSLAANQPFVRLRRIRVIDGGAPLRKGVVGNISAAPRRFMLYVESCHIDTHLVGESLK